MDCKQLQGIIGQKLNYKGHDCEVIEVLEDGPLLVLRELPNGSQGEDSANDLPSLNPIQPNQFGEAHRRTPETFTVPALDKENRIIPFLQQLLNQA